ncbi:hypothetical protein GQ42DRAFT_179498 [Ramicandelaber brevisporus]|nr:hypothetical protein GQ42DRAFT_179498 [Ramicandelaber brevisporus]
MSDDDGSSNSSWFEVDMNKLNAVTPQLLISGIREANNIGLLRSNRVTHIVSAVDGHEPPYPEVFKYLTVDVIDSPNVRIEPLLDQVADFIHSAIDGSENSRNIVLVHCVVGMSRSATVLAAYLIKYRGMLADQAIEYIKRARPIVSPNLGFRRQLRQFESRIQATILSQQVQQSTINTTIATAIATATGAGAGAGAGGLSLLQRISAASSSANNAAASSSTENLAIGGYLCKKCRYQVIEDPSFIVPHEVGEGQSKFSFRKRDQSAKSSQVLGMGGNASLVAGGSQAISSSSSSSPYSQSAAGASCSNIYLDHTCKWLMESIDSDMEGPHLDSQTLKMTHTAATPANVAITSATAAATMEATAHSIMRHRGVTTGSTGSTGNDESSSATNSGSESPSTPHRKSYHKRPSFRPRKSLLDSEHLVSSLSPHRGILTLFWIVIAWYFLQVLADNYAATGVLFQTELFYVLTANLGSLFVADMAMVFGSAYVVMFHKWLVLGGMKMQADGWTVIILQHVLQLAFITIPTLIAWTSNWGYTQRIFYIAHTITHLMKIHSYIEANRTMHVAYEEVRTLQQQLQQQQQQQQQQQRTSISTDSVEDRIDELSAQLSNGSMKYPQNVTFANFADFVLIPTLVYELAYPRTRGIRPGYVVEKLFGIAGILTCLYIVVEYHMRPVMAVAFPATVDSPPLLATYMRLMLPTMLTYNLVFFIIFDMICNIFAELTCFADRAFYDDWWNCTNWDQYSRKWNRPVHKFLSRHVYAPIQNSQWLARLTALRPVKLANGQIKQRATLSPWMAKQVPMFITFLLSSLVHELVLDVGAGKVSWYILSLQMTQLALIPFKHMIGWSEIRAPIIPPPTPQSASPSLTPSLQIQTIPQSISNISNMSNTSNAASGEESDTASIALSASLADESSPEIYALSRFTSFGNALFWLELNVGPPLILMAYWRLSTLA